MTIRLLALFALLTIGAALSPAAADDVYWVENGAVWRADIDSGVPELVVDAAVAEAAGGGLDVDPDGGKVYWTAYIGPQFHAVIRRSDLDGSNVETFGGGGKNSLGDLALDLDNDKLYYTDPSDCVPGCGRVLRTELDGANSETVYSTDVPEAVDVDSGLGTVCWGDSFNDWIQCGPLDGSGAVTMTETTPNGLALAPAGGSLFWTDAADDSIRRMDLDSTSVHDILTGLADPYGIVIDSNTSRMYWTERSSGKLRRAKLDGTDVEDVVTGLDAPLGLALDIPPPVDPVPASTGIGAIAAVLLLLTASSVYLRKGCARPIRRSGARAAC